jgi:hypothetical protein
MEARVPLCNVILSGGTTIKALNGRSFKMNLKVYDDDTSAVASAKNPTVGLGFERYLKWWSYGTRLLPEPLPTFILSGTPSEELLRPLPDLKNLYCGQTVEYYESLCDCNSAVELSSPHTSSSLFVNLSPNPVQSYGVLSVGYNGLNVPVTISLYDIAGRRLVNSVVSSVSGVHRLNIGSGIRAGQYFVRMDSPSGSITRSFVVLK